jgi:hypothetical protein
MTDFLDIIQNSNFYLKGHFKDWSLFPSYSGGTVQWSQSLFLKTRSNMIYKSSTYETICRIAPAYDFCCWPVAYTAFPLGI